VEKEVGNNIIVQTIFENENSRECTLLIEFYNKGYTFSIFKNNTNTVLFTGVSDTFLDFFNANENQLVSIFEKEKVFNYSYSKVVVLIDTFYNTLVPTVFFDQSKKKEFLSFNTKLPSENLVFLDDLIQNVSYHNIYVSTISFSKVLKNTFVNSDIVCTSSLLINNAKKVTNSGAFFQVHLGLDTLECIYFNNGLLEFNNSFNYNNAEDVIYNVLNVFKQLNLNTEETVLFLSGNISNDDEKFELLYMYIKNIEFMKRPIKLNYVDKVKQIPEHYFVQHYIALL